MATTDVYTATGDADGSVDLDDAVFGAKVNVGVMHQVVVAQLASARAGTSKTKRRGEAAGGGAKPWRQKGTGRARQGSIRSPQWSGGGIAHGPTGDQNYTKRVNKKLKRAALRSALSDRAATGAVRVISGIGFDVPSTKDAVAFVAALELVSRKVLLVLAGRDDVVFRSFRNLRDVHVLTVDQLNTYDVLCSDVIVFDRDALDYVGTGRRRDLDERQRVGGRASEQDLDEREVSE